MRPIVQTDSGKATLESEGLRRVGRALDPSRYVSGNIFGVPGLCFSSNVNVVSDETKWAFEWRGAKLGSAGMDEHDTGSNRPDAARGLDEQAACADRVDPRQWVDRHGDYLFRYALLRVRDAQTAEDLVQDTLLAAWQAVERFEGTTSERGWLTGILRHKILDHFRRQKRQPVQPLTEALPPELEDRFDDLGLWKPGPGAGPADWGEDAATLIQRREFLEALEQCLAKLPPRCADAFVLREMEAVESYRVQEVLGISASHFWVLLHRARLQLRQCLEQNWLHPDPQPA